MNQQEFFTLLTAHASGISPRLIQAFERNPGLSVYFDQTNDHQCLGILSALDEEIAQRRPTVLQKFAKSVRGVPSMICSGVITSTGICGLTYSALKVFNDSDSKENLPAMGAIMGASLVFTILGVISGLGATNVICNQESELENFIRQRLDGTDLRDRLSVRVVSTAGLFLEMSTYTGETNHTLVDPLIDSIMDYAS